MLVAFARWYLIKLNRYIFSKVAEGVIRFQDFRPSWAPTTERLLSLVLIVLGILVAFPYIPGSESPAFRGVSIFLDVLVSLGSTGLISNIVSGIMLTYMDSFQRGDLVNIGSETGYVVRSSLFTTTLRTRTNRIITLPNASILSTSVVNYSNPGETGIVVTALVGIGYDEPWRQVEAILKLAASRTACIREDPPPFVLERALNQFDVTYELNAHLKPAYPIYLAEAELNRQILDAFNEFGVQIMTPLYETDPAQLKVVPRSEWRAAPAESDNPGV